MNRVEMLARLHKLSWDADEWFAGLTMAIDGVDARQAAWQPPGGGNTIWQTVNHLNFFDERTLARLQHRKPKYDAETNEETFGEPGDPNDEAGWRATMAETQRIGSELQAVLASLSDADLDQPFIEGSEQTRAEALTAWVLHDGHHTGQILLLRKQAGSWPAQR